ncbi:MAG: DUF3667 domain-containing protein [Flavobacterium sp.]
MSGHKLREDKICQNCYYTVDRAYCSNCGQKNTDTRQSFGHLIAHFAGDLTHYDGAFWKTMKDLLFRPARLTKEYLEGKRQTYVPPVKLYIFISFVTFFTLATVVNLEDGENVKSVPEKVEPATPIVIDTGKEHTYESVAQLDSLRKYGTGEDKISDFEYYVAKSALKQKEGKISDKYIFEKTLHTLPKVLFIYMPVFAFWLWLFHGKKRWYFFDHGIFTLHYFSFLLLALTLNMILSALMSYIPWDRIATVVAILWSATGLYAIFYFFRAHGRMYNESTGVSVLKSIFLFIINLVCIVVALIASFVYIFNNLD